MLFSFRQAARALGSTRVRLGGALGLAALVASAGAALLTAQAVPVSNPPVLPHSVLVFPQRDFVSASGFSQTDIVRVRVIHPNGTTFTTGDIVPQDDPRALPGAPFAGIVEVNHPGGACWVGTTPDIRPGDRVQTIATNTDPVTGASTVTIDETTVANVVARRPVIVKHESFAGALDGIVAIHGSAQTALGAPVPDAQLEQRLVANRDAFDLNGRRTLRATSVAGASDGVLAYDPISATNPAGIKWTATYIGLDEADVLRAAAAETRIMWLGAGAAGAEATVFEIGAGVVAGPAAPCTAPLEVLPPPPGSELIPPSVPANLTATVTGANTVHLSWAPSTDNVGVTSYGIYRNGLAISNVSNADGSANPPTTFDDLNVAPGTYTYTVDASDAIGNRSAQSAPATATTTLQTATAFPVCSATVGEPCISEPPANNVQIIAFPARDFTSSSGYLPNDQVVVQVVRNGFVISASTVIPQDDPTTVGFDGIVEVNHPGGGCWDGVTPDLRVGDIVRQIAYAPDLAVTSPDGSHPLKIRAVDQTRSANVSVLRPVIVRAATPGLSNGIIEAHGTAMDANGKPLPLANITQRLIANRDAFDFNGRRTLRAGGAGKDGVLVYDTVNNPTGIKFTATYTGLDEDDVFRAVGGTTSTGRTFAGSESRILWLDDPVAVAPGMTIYENSDVTISGPAAGACTAPIEALDAQPPTAVTVTAAQVGPNSLQLNWTASTDNFYVYGYGVYRDGVRIRNLAGTVTSFLDVNVPFGVHTYQVDAVDSASPLKVNFGPGQGNPGPNVDDPILQGVEWGNRSVLSNTVTSNQADVIAPTIPRNVTARVNISAVTLNWSPSTDNVGVASYRIYRNGTAVGNSTLTTFNETVPANGTYTYTVDAADAAGNRSALSAPATAIVTGLADTIAPTQPAALTADTRDLHAGITAPALGPHDILLSWSASTDNVGVTGYSIYRRVAANGVAPAGAFAKIADVGAGIFTYADVGVATGTYDYTVEAFDSAGNRSLTSPIASAVSVNDPPVAPHSIISFPARDFVSSAGFSLDEGPVIVSVIRNGKLIASSTPITPQPDPLALPGDPFAGLVEVNHPGGGCWVGVTPDIGAGDIIRTTTALGIADQTTTANVTTLRATTVNADGTPLPPGTIQTHGTAQDAFGNALTVDAVESRLVANRDLFDFNGRRVLRAGGAGNDGVLVFDPIGPANPRGINWTATFSGLDAADVARALGAEARALWLGHDPLAGVELTIFENGDGVVGGPAAPCAAPLAPITAPNVVGLTQTAASATITAAGLAVGAITTVNSATVPGGQVISQVPAGGALVASGSLVSLVVSAGAAPVFTVPSVVGLTQAAATTAITNAGLVVGAISTANSATVPSGSVISQSPIAGASVAPGSSVALTVSLGPAPVTVPTVDKVVFSDGLGRRTTAAFSTVAAGEVLVAFAASDGPAAANAQTLTITGAGLTWTRVQRAATRLGDAEIWTATAPTVLTNVTVSSTQSAAGFHQSLTVVAFTGVGGVGASNIAGGVGAPSVSLVAQAAGSAVYAVGNDWDSATARTVPGGQTMVHQFVDTAVGDTFWVQAANGLTAASGATVTLNDTAPAGDQFNFAIVELKAGVPPATTTVPDVVGQTQAAASAAITGAGLTVGNITSANSATVPAGSVISESPAAGTTIVTGSPVALVVSAGPSLAPPAVDASVSSDGAGARSVALTTTAPGDVLVAFAASDGPVPPNANTQSLTIAGGGLTWTRVQRAATARGVSEIWTATAPAALTAVITSTQSVTLVNGLAVNQSLTVVAFKGATAIGASNIASGASGAPTVSLVAQAAGSAIYGVGNDFDQAIARTVPAGQTKVHEFLTPSGDTMWVQSLNAATSAAGATATLNDTAPTADQWNFAIVEIKR